MESGSSALPSYGNPPVVEVALAVQFSGLMLHGPQLGLFWQEIRDRYPNIEEHPPLSPMREEFDPAKPSPIKVEFTDRPPMPRYWFVAEDGRTLTQVQYDRFAHNWRKTGDEDSYPRYEGIREIFEERLRHFVEFVTDGEPAAVSFDFCEITYINHVTPNEFWADHGQLDRILRTVQPAPASEFRPAAEDTQVTHRFIISDGDEPIGRLTVSASPVYAVADNTPMYLLTLTARGRPVSRDVEGVGAFLDRGREWIVRTFTDLTTDEMHIAWGREA